MSKIAAYIRCSTDKQDTTHQRIAIENWIASRKYGEYDVYEDEGISGTTDERPEFQRLLKDVKAGKVKHVVTFEMSRLSRDFVTFLNTLEVFRKHSVTVEVPGEGVQKFDTATDKLLASVKAFSAAGFIEDHSKRIKSGMAAAKAEAKAKGKDLKFGGRREGAGRKRKTYEPEIVAKIRALQEKNFSTRLIAEFLSISQSKVSRIVRRCCH